MLLTTKFKILIFLLAIGIFVFFQKVFSGQLILSQSFSIGFITIHYYGIIMALAVLVGYVVAMNRVNYFNITETQADNLIFWTCVSGFVGARFYHVLSSFSYYVNNPIDILKVWNGGLSIYGAVLAGLFGLYTVSKILNLKSSILNLLNWLTPSLIIGQIIGRFGNLFNYEAFGYPTNLPWGMFVPVSFRPIESLTSPNFHPFFLYEILGNLIILIIILAISRPSTRRPQNGEWERWPSVRGSVTPLTSSLNFPIPLRGDSLFFYYLLLYNILRFCLEFLRIDSTFIGIFRLNSLTSLLLILVSLVCIKYYKNAQIS